MPLCVNYRSRQSQVKWLAVIDREDIMKKRITIRKLYGLARDDGHHMWLVGICDVLGISIVRFAERFETLRKAFK